MEDIVTPRKRCRTLSSLTALKTVNPNLSPECNSVGLVPTKNIDNISEESTRERTSSFVIQRENFSILGTPRSGCGRIAQASTLMLSKIPVKLSSSREKLFDNVISKNYKKDQRRLLIFAVLMKIFVISLALGAYYSQKSFDISGDVFVDFYKNSSPIQGGVNNFWKKFEGYFMDSMKPFVRWDALYFLGISEHGYTFEQQHAFFPFFPILIRGIRDSLLAPLSTVLCPMARSILAGFLISNISFVLAAISVYKFSLSFFDDQQLAYYSAVFFIIQPANIFMSSIYTESLFSLLVFIGLRLFFSRKRFFAALIFSLATLTRSNGLLNIGFFGYDLLRTFFSSGLSLKKKLGNVLINLFYMGVVASGFLAFQYYGYTQYCTEGLTRPWCNNRIPDLYSFVQSNYWNIGWFKYYEVIQIPNFAIAAPFILVSLAGIFSYIKHDPTRFFSLGFTSRADKLFVSNGYYHKDMLPFVYLWIAMLMTCTFLMHVQVMIRFFSSLLPFFWFMGHIVRESSSRSSQDTFGKSEGILRNIWASLLLKYFFLAATVHTILFACFYPPA